MKGTGASMDRRNREPPNTQPLISTQAALEAFVDGLSSLEGVDRSVANLIQELWQSGQLNRVTLLSALRASRSTGAQNDDQD